MTHETIASISRWPNVPACYGWLALDPRGQWRLGEDGGEVVYHAGLKAYLNQNYAVNERGEWFVQNGPQRVYVNLLRAPYVVSLDAAGEWQTHTGLAVRRITRALVDAEGHAYLVCEHGLAGIDDRDLCRLLESAAADNVLIDTISVTLGDVAMPLEAIDAELLPTRFGFTSQPQPSVDP